MTPIDLFTSFATLLGACVGSFLNVCIYRIPTEGMTIARPRGSFCPKCRAPIRWHDNIPILAWLALGGKCRACRAPISWRYPVIELLTAALFLVIWLRFGPSDATELPSLAMWGTVAFWWATFAAMLVIAMIDIDHRIIPDEISVTGGAAILLVVPLLHGVPPDRSGLETIQRVLEPLDRAIAPGSGSWIQGGLALCFGAAAMAAMRRFSRDWQGNRRTWWGTRWAGAVGAVAGIGVGGLLCHTLWLHGPSAAALVPSLLGSAIGAGTIYAIGVAGKLAFRKEAMGFGDVKLMGLLGAFLGLQYVLLAIFVASFLGSVIGVGLRLITRSSYIPFGPFLCAGASILVLASDQVDAAIRWYLSLFR